MAAEVFNRYEHKYIIEKETFDRIKPVIEANMMPDKHNDSGRFYTISNIYFDTDDDFLIRNSLSKPVYKEKLRLRRYGAEEDNPRAFLEIKKKFNGIVNKRRTAIGLDEAMDFVKTGKIPPVKEYMNKQILKEIEYFLNCYDLKPKLYLAYDRIAYFDKNDPDLRISFDANIRSRRNNVALDCGDYGELIFDSGKYLMEIKTSRSKPLWLCNMLTEHKIRRVSFSKYGTEFKARRFAAI